MQKNIFNQKGVTGIAIAFIIAAILVIVAGAYFLMGKKPASPSVSNSEKSAVHNTPSGTDKPVDSGSTTIQDVIGRNKNLECDFTLPSSGNNPNPFGTGKLYTTGNKGRSMMSGSVSGMSMEANAIYKDDTAYSWVHLGQTTMGFKFDKDKMEEMSNSMTPQQKQQGEQFRQKMNFKCKPWIPDESKFVLPTGVEFK